MAMACRHCFGRDEFTQVKREDNQQLQLQSSYLESLVYSSSAETQKLQSVLEWVESIAAGGKGMPGIITWCHSCKKVSVLSYTYYLMLSRDVDKLPEDSILSMSAYYTRMCMGAELCMKMVDGVQNKKKHE